MDILTLYRNIRLIEKSFSLQIEEVADIIENVNKIPRWKIFDKFLINENHLQTLSSKSGISLSIDHNIYSKNVIKWLIEEELKWQINDELPLKFTTKIITEYRLTRLLPYADKLKEANTELLYFPRNFILFNLAYPDIFKPWQFRHLNREYWKSASIGKYRLAGALRWLIEKKKGIARDLVPNIKGFRSFLTTRELEYYHLSKAFRIHFNNQKEWIDYTYPENLTKTIREDATKLIEILKLMIDNITHVNYAKQVKLLKYITLFLLQLVALMKFII